MEVKYQVFVSSTYEDLKDERKEVIQSILEAHCIPAGMELFPASNKAQWEVIKKVIDNSDFYVLIIAGKYGSMGIDSDGNKVGYTEMEYDYAVEKEKPILALLYDDIETLPKNKSEASLTKQRKLKRFREKVCAGRLIRKWSNKDNLKSATLAALIELKATTKEPGWIRANFKIEQQSYSFLEEQREKYESEILSLKDELCKKEIEVRRLANFNDTIEKKMNELEKR